MTSTEPRTCRHCGKPVEPCNGPAPGVPCGWTGWVHYSRHGSHYCDDAERTTVAEPGGSE